MVVHLIRDDLKALAGKSLQQQEIMSVKLLQVEKAELTWTMSTPP